MKIQTILDKINSIKESKQIGNKSTEKKKVISLLDKFKTNFEIIDNLITETKKTKPKSKSSDKVVKELEKLLAKQEKEFLKVVNRLKLDIDKDNLIEPTKKNMKKIENRIGASGGLIQFNYTDPLTHGSAFTKDHPLDRHPLVVFISNIGTGKDGNIHFVGINIHHIQSNYRKMFWNWIVREFLIVGKNNRRKLEVPNTLYYTLADNAELRYALQGYRRYSYGVAKNIKKIPLKDYDKIFTPPYRARYFVWNDRKSRLVPR